jgi:transposase
MVKRIENREKVYIGIDVHKRTFSVSCVVDGVVAKRTTMTASAQKLVTFVKRGFADFEIYSAYEAGFSGFGLHRYLESAGFNNIVVNPASIEVAARDKVKTDRRDSAKVAIQLAAGRLKGIRVPALDEELRRLVTRTRDQLVRSKTRLGHQIKSKLYQFGFIGPDDQPIMSEKFLESHLRLSLPDELRFALNSLVRMWRALNEELKIYRREIQRQAKDNSELETVYRSVPGIGPIGARTLANELGDMSQFQNQRQLYSFTGLTPGEWSSGDKRRLGHISRQGAARLRYMLTESAWVAVRRDPALEEDYKRIAATAGSKKAIVAIARKLIGRVRGCFRKAELYRLGYEEAA